MTRGHSFPIFLHVNITNFAQKLGLDYEKIVEDYCGDMQALAHDILVFPELCRLDDVEKALNEKDVTAVHTAAHRMRKAAEKLSLDEIVRLSRRLEEASIDRAHSLLGPLGKEISAYNKALED